MLILKSAEIDRNQNERRGLKALDFVGRLRGHFKLLFAFIIFLCLGDNIFASDAIFSNSPKFKIPFQFDENELKKIGAKEIELYTSDNQGASWRLHEAVSPQESGFVYEAVSDGEYWFSVRTKTESGLTYPAGPHQAGLKVIVDTVQPELELDVAEIESGKIKLSWNVIEKNPQVESLHLEVHRPQQGRWEAVEFEKTVRGETLWNVSQAGLVEVRGSVRDAAGNQAEIATQTIVAGNLSEEAPQQSRSRPIASNVEQNATMLSNQPVELEVNESKPKSILTSKPSGSSDLVLPQHLKEVTPDRSRIDNQSVMPQLEEKISGVTPPERETPQVATLRQLTPPDVPVKEFFPEKKPLVLVPNSKPGLKQLKPVEPLQNMESLLEQPKPTKVRKNHLVNSTTFRIAYEIEDVGPSGVSKIELYITEDQGKTWFHYGSDSDNVSPMVVSVPKDGDYGFSFRIRNGVGLIATPPQPNDQPEILVTVDQTAPQAELYSVKQGKFGNQDQVVIEWAAKDRELDEYPIALYYATQETGPWELIKGWTANTKRLDWTIPDVIEKNFYIRLDVRDAAGNITRIDGDQAYTIDRSRPKAKITDVESLKVQPK